MKVRICVVRDVVENVYRAYGSGKDQASREDAITFMVEDGFNADQILWVEAELPEIDQVIAGAVVKP